MQSPESGILPEHYNDLHTSKPVERALRAAERDGEVVDVNKKRERISTYLQRIEHVTSSERGADLLQSMVERDFVLNIDDPALVDRVAVSLYESEKQLAVNRGLERDIQQLEGNEELLEQYRQLVYEKHTQQRHTLAPWLEYVRANDADYPTWFRYYVVRGLKGMGAFNRESKSYARRSEDTVAPFPELNAEAVGFVYRALESELGLQQLPKKERRAQRDAFVVEAMPTNDQPEEFDQEQFEADLLQRLQSHDFAKLYAFAQVETEGSLDRSQVAGEWVKYTQGSDPSVLEAALNGKGTGWCTATGSAASQLNDGDFYVFFSHNQDGEATEPRVAIRMEGGSVAEIRGIDKNQEMEPEMLGVAQEFYQDLPGAESYVAKEANTQRLTEITQRVGESSPQHYPYTAEELRFLYEVDGPIETFGYARDPRIDRLLAGRDFRQDLAQVLECAPEQISITKEEALAGGIAFHYGDLNLASLTSARGLKLPDSIGGYLYLASLTSAEGLELPDSIGGYLDLSSLTSAEGLKLPDSIGKGLSLYSLTSAEGLELPSSIGGFLYLASLTSAEGLELPSSIDGYLNLSSLTSARGLKFPDSIGKGLNLSSLTSAEGLELPDSIGGDLYLTSLASAEGLELPDSIGGDLYLTSLTSVEGLELPLEVNTVHVSRYMSSEHFNLLRERYPTITFIR